MGDMTMKKIYMLFPLFAFAIIATVVSAVDVGSKMTTFEEQRTGFPIAFAANPYDCSMNTNDIASIAMGFKIPKSIPEGYGVKDSFANVGELGLFYATGDMCGPEATQKSLADGVIMYYTANRDSSIGTIKDPEVHFGEYKKNSDYPDRIIITQIAGHTAMFWHSGIEKNIYVQENGEIFAEEDSPYPAQITIVDKENGELYMVRGYVPLDILEQMIKSAILSKAP
jgi:hypothetical protein